MNNNQGFDNVLIALFNQQSTTPLLTGATFKFVPADHNGRAHILVTVPNMKIMQDADFNKIQDIAEPYGLVAATCHEVNGNIEIWIVSNYRS